MKGIANNYYIVLLSNNLERKRTYFVQEEKGVAMADRPETDSQRINLLKGNKGNNILLTGRILLMTGNIISITGIQKWLIMMRSQPKYF